MPPKRMHVKRSQGDNDPDIDTVSNNGRPKWSTLLMYWLPKSQLTAPELTDLITQTKEIELQRLQAAAQHSHLQKPTEIPADWSNEIIAWCETCLVTLFSPSVTPSLFPPTSTVDLSIPVITVACPTCPSTWAAGHSLLELLSVPLGPAEHHSPASISLTDTPSQSTHAAALATHITSFWNKFQTVFLATLARTPGACCKRECFRGRRGWGEYSYWGW